MLRAQQGRPSRIGNRTARPPAERRPGHRPSGAGLGAARRPGRGGGGWIPLTLARRLGAVRGAAVGCRPGAVRRVERGGGIRLGLARGARGARCGEGRPAAAGPEAGAGARRGIGFLPAWGATAQPEGRPTGRSKDSRGAQSGAPRRLAVAVGFELPRPACRRLRGLSTGVASSQVTDLGALPT